MNLSVLIDAQYVDFVAGDMRKYYRGQLGRDMPKADLAYWLDCVALDAGVRPGENSINAYFVHDKAVEALEQFVPAHLTDEISGKAFADNLGEFSMQSLPVEDIVSRQQMIADCVQQLAEDKQTDAVVVVAETLDRTSDLLKDAERIMQCSLLPAEGYEQETLVLGYSLLSALGISPEEILNSHQEE